MRCWQYQIARDQRDSELDFVGHDRGCAGYYRQGCYNCEGFDKQCEIYQNQLELEREGVSLTDS